MQSIALLKHVKENWAKLSIGVSVSQQIIRNSANIRHIPAWS